MTIQELKEHALAEHARDKELTIINFAIYGVLILIVAVIIFYFKNIFLAQISTAPSNMIWIVVLGVSIMLILYPIYKIYKLDKRIAQLDDLFSKLESGAKASLVKTDAEYKMVLPLIKWNFYFFPIYSLNIVLDGFSTIYSLPLKRECIVDAKSILSGANMDNLYKAFDELYADDSTTTTIATPIKSEAEFRTFLKDDLGDDVTQVESDRKNSKKYLLIFGGISAVIAITWMGYNVFNSMSVSSTGSFNYMKILIPMVIFFGISMAFSMYMKFSSKNNNNAMASGFEFNFKTKIFEKMIAFINPTAQYIMHGHATLPEFLESGLFLQKNYGINGNDHIIGKHNGVPFQFCDLEVSFLANFSKENEAPDSVFDGQFFVARFNKQFASSVYIIPKRKLKAHFTDNDIDMYTNTFDEKVLLEDPEFMKLYDVYSNDQVEARYILTPSLMQRIKDLTARTKGSYFIGFNNNRITVANNSKNNLFEASTFASFTANDNALLVGFYKDLCDQFAIIDELKLNVNIWKK